MKAMNGREGHSRERKNAQIFSSAPHTGLAVAKIPVQGGPIGGIAISRDGGLRSNVNNGTDTVSVVGDTCRVTTDRHQCQRTVRDRHG